MFKDVGQITSALGEQQYISTDEISTVIFLADQLQKPVLTEGPAGVGKTELAKAWAKANGRQLIRLQCYEGLDESKALYEWEYAKQMLYTQLLRDKLSELLANAGSLTDAADRLGQEENVFFSERFLLARPLLQAITAPEPVVLLIDEIDRADAEFEAFLLEILSDFQVSVPELGTITARHRPTVILTSNNTRELSEALKRRCLYLFIDYPSHESELRIVKMRVPELNARLAQQAVEVVQQLRQMDLKKNPSVSETIDWAKSLVMLNADSLDKHTLETTLTVLLKHESDVQKARRAISGGSREQPLNRRSGDARGGQSGQRGWSN
ncbi:MAG: MoxR family ATPase [Anaerolineae bacterium]|nr:MoxR family ATPase [Anaerolineae bacterium]